MTKTLRDRVPESWAVVGLDGCHLFVAPDRAVRYALTLSYFGGQDRHELTAFAYAPAAEWNRAGRLSPRVESYELETGVGTPTDEIVDCAVAHVHDLHHELYEDYEP